MSNNAASSTPIRSLRFCTACKLLLPLLLLLLSFTSVLTSPLCCCRSCCCCLWSRPSSCLLFFRYRIPQALQSDLGPVGPLRHMGVVVARHSTQPLAPLSATAMPSICSRQRSVGEVGHKIAGRGGRLNKGKRASRRVDLTAIGRTHRRRRQQRTASIRGRIAWRNLVPALVSWLLCFLEACSRD